MAQAIREALREEMARDKTVFLMGEDIGFFGGPFGVTKGLRKEFGETRVRDTPISEAGFIGAAIGAAITGMRPVVEVQYSDFLTCGMDQIANQAAKMSLVSGGQIKVPIVVRAPTGATGRGAQHSQSLYAWFMHCPGLKVVVPSSPYDAKGLLKASIRGDNPVLFFEHKLLYGSRSIGAGKKASESNPPSTAAFIPEEEYTIPFGKAEVKRRGEDVTVVATLLMVRKALAAAEMLSDQGIIVEVVDPRTLVPFDKQTVIGSVRKTGRLVIVDEGCRTGGVAAEIAAIIAEEAMDYLDAPIKRVATLDAPIPFAPRLEKYVIPSKAGIVKAIKEVMA
jgi:pyruvate dehydrogenase E1 component beta subunit